MSIGEKKLNFKLMYFQMDKHLNLFYSYNQGNLDNIERTKQLEDNLTRAFIITLSTLEKSDLQKYLRTLINGSLNSSVFSFDLQNTDKELNLNQLSKYVLTIQREKSNIKLCDIKKLEPTLISELRNKNNILKELIRALKNNGEYKFNGQTFQATEISSLIELLHDNRPDAWIIGDKEVILIESKIGYNSVSSYQIYRHIKGQYGFNISSEELSKGNIKIINLTWEEISNGFKELNKSSFIVNEFNKYLIMTSQKFDLMHLIEQDFDFEIQKSQFELLLSKIDEKLHKINCGLKRLKRPKNNLWDSYALEEKNPHYTIFFNGRKSIEINLTTTSRNMFLNSLNEIENFYNEVNSGNKILKIRYSIKLLSDKLVDPLRGAQRGESQRRFTFESKFSEIKNFNVVRTILENIHNGINYKQIEIGFNIDFFDFSKIRSQEEADQIRLINKNLISNSESLVSEIVNFMLQTKAIFVNMANTR